MRRCAQNRRLQGTPQARRTGRSGGRRSFGRGDFLRLGVVTVGGRDMPQTASRAVVVHLAGPAVGPSATAARAIVVVDEHGGPRG